MTVPFVFDYSVGFGGTYLQLCQSLIVECGISGNMTTTVGQVGEFARVANWIRQSWVEIQNQHDEWGFMRSSYLNQAAGCTFTTTSGQSLYPLGDVPGTTCMVIPEDFGKWDVYSFRNYTTANIPKSDEIFMSPISYDQWRDSYEYGALRQTVTRPVAVAIAPDMSVCVGPPSNGLYTVEGDYWVSPQIFIADGDFPLGLLQQYQMLIVYRAMKKYAAYEAAPEVATRAQEEYDPMYRQLEAKYGPVIMEGAALA